MLNVYSKSQGSKSATDFPSDHLQCHQGQTNTSTEFEQS